jgi:hypothetical protein
LGEEGVASCDILRGVKSATDEPREGAARIIGDVSGSCVISGLDEVSDGVFVDVSVTGIVSDDVVGVWVTGVVSDDVRVVVSSDVGIVSDDVIIESFLGEDEI